MACGEDSARISNAMAVTYWNRKMLLVADADRKACGKHGTSIHAYLQLAVVWSWLVDSVASTLDVRKKTESAPSADWLHTLVKAVRAIVIMFMLHDVGREEYAAYSKEIRNIRIEAGRRASTLAAPKKRGDLFVRDPQHPAGGYFYHMKNPNL